MLVPKCLPGKVETQAAAYSRPARAGQAFEYNDIELVLREKIGHYSHLEQTVSMSRNGLSRVKTVMTVVNDGLLQVPLPGQQL